MSEQPELVARQDRGFPEIIIVYKIVYYDTFLKANRLFRV